MPCCNAAHTSVYSAFFLFMQLYSSHSKTAHVALQALFLRFSLFHRPRYQTDTSGYNTTCDTLEHITATQHLQRIPDTTTAPGRCTGQHSRPIIIMYIRAYPCYGSMPDGATYHRPCKPGGVSMLLTPGDLQSSTGSAVRAGRSGTLHPAGQSSSRERGGRRGTIGGYRRISFRAFAR